MQPSSTGDNGGPIGSSDADLTEINPCTAALETMLTEPEIALLHVILEEQKRRQRVLNMACMLGMHEELYLHRAPKRVTGMPGIQWVEETLEDSNECLKMFRMRPYVFELLHEVLVQSYGLQSTAKMTSRESLGMVLWMLGSPQSVWQARNRFARSSGTVSRKFEEVIGCLLKLAKDNVCPKDPTFSTVHPKVANHRYGHAFRNCIGALDGTHVKVCVPGEQVGKYINRKSEKSQNVLGIVDLDRRFTFVAAGIPGSAHDYRVLREARQKFGANFPNPPPGTNLPCVADI